MSLSQSGVCLSFPDPDVLVINGTHGDKLKTLPVLPATEASEISPPSLSLAFSLLGVKTPGKESYVAVSLKRRHNEQIIFCYL